MTRFRDIGEPISAGRSDRHATYLPAFRDALFTIIFFAAVMAINGVVAILIIAFLQSVGVWEVSPPANAEDGFRHLAGPLRASRLDQPGT